MSEARRLVQEEDGVTRDVRFADYHVHARDVKSLRPAESCPG